jgi:serine/threonine protein phosphatase PrpC
MEYRAAARTDVGRKRTGNEDSFCLAPEMGLFVVADGMGGHAAGEVASRLAVETIQEWMRKYLEGDATTFVGPLRSSGPREVNFLLSSIRLANRVIFEMAQSDPRCAGMGTTLVAALGLPNRLVLAHVGDSRIYRIHGAGIAQLSKDHSLVQQQVDRGILTPEQAQTSQYRHMITRALGLKEAIEVDVTEQPAHAGDCLLLCSDGLSDLLEDEEMLRVVREHGTDPEGACQALVDLANYKGGDDNITVLLIQVGENAQGNRGMFTRLKSLWRA